VWDKETIVYLGQVRIPPPYTLESCILTEEAKTMRNADRALSRVKDLINAYKVAQ
jgi:hypothetical protein